MSTKEGTKEWFDYRLGKVTASNATNKKEVNKSDSKSTPSPSQQGSQKEKPRD